MRILLVVITLSFVSLKVSGHTDSLNNTDTLDSNRAQRFDSLLQIEPTQALYWKFYKNRYHEKDLMYKVTDNWGNGFDSLYGTRNLRPILHGVAYRGGANNYFHKENKRSNHNPLPDDGIRNLCEEGFSQSVYLYRNNFETAAPKDTCSCVNGAYNVMEYSQLDYYDPTHIRSMLEMVHQSIVDDKVGPVYLHCWNGWHASGLISAIILKQFCGYSSWDAVNYWDLGTDGANKSPRYQKIREMIKDFEPYEDLMVTDSLGNLICPDMPDVIDSSQLHIEIEHLAIVPEAIPQGYDIVLYNVSFGPNQTTFSNAQSNPDIVSLVKALKQHLELKVEIGGYTDNTGSYAKNKSLSAQRAKFVYDQVLTAGISKERLSYKGYGESKPLYSNRYKSGREGNRRIEVKILEKHSESGILVDESQFDRENKKQEDAVPSDTEKSSATATETVVDKPKEETQADDQKVAGLSDREKGITLSGVHKFSNDYDTRIQLQRNYLLDQVKFEPYAIVLNGESVQLNNLATLLKNHTQWKVTIVGYTDDSGEPQANLKLSQQRAQAVKDYLTQRGITADRLTAEGKGEANPIAPNKYSWGRAQNRRIEVTLH